MPIIVFRPKPSVICALDIGVLYSDGTVERRVIDFVKSQPDLEQPSTWPNLVAHMQKLFLSEGDKEELRDKYGSHPCEWYMASCEMLILGGIGTTAYCQVGTIHAYASKADVLDNKTIAPIHNVKSEFDKGTIEGSLLVPFSTRTQAEIARQLLQESPELVEKLEGMKRSQFLNAISHVTTRCLGFFQSSSTDQHAKYQSAIPIPAIGTVIDSELVDSVVLYFPTVRELTLYDQYRIAQVVKIKTESSLLPVNDCEFQAERGRAVRVNRTAGSQWSQFFSYGPVESDDREKGTVRTV